VFETEETPAATTERSSLLRIAHHPIFPTDNNLEYNTMAWPFFNTTSTNAAESLSSSRDEAVGDDNMDLYIILGGVAFAVVLFCVALYWILRSDRIQRQRRRLLWEVQLRTSRNTNEETSDLSRQAGFHGLSITEREKILGEWLRRTAFEYPEEEEDADIEKGCGSDTAATDDEDDNQSQQENVCSICFDAYTAGDSVMTGTQCKHMFHAHCAREWLLSKSNNDHCPYCRVEILRPDEFREEAKTVLGDARVVELLGEKRDNDVKEEDIESNDSDTDDEEAGSSTTASVHMELGSDY